MRDESLMSYMYWNAQHIMIIINSNVIILCARLHHMQPPIRTVVQLYMRVCGG